MPNLSGLDGFFEPSNIALERLTLETTKIALPSTAKQNASTFLGAVWAFADQSDFFGGEPKGEMFKRGS